MSNTSPAAKSASKTVKTTKPKTTKVATKAAPSGVRPDLSKVRRGLKKVDAVKVVENFKFPTKPFTLNDIFAATGIYHWYLVEFVKKNANIVGDAPKAPGVRGKAAKLYQFKAATTVTPVPAVVPAPAVVAPKAVTSK